MRDENNEIYRNDSDSEVEIDDHNKLSGKRIRKPTHRFSDSEENERAKLMKEKQRSDNLNLIDSVFGV